MKAINKTLERMLNRLAEQSGTVDFLRLSRAWKKAVGPLVAERSFVFKYDRGTVFIGVSDSVWVQELLLRKQDWLKQLQRDSGIPVKEILFFPKARPRGKNRPFSPGR